MSKTPTCVSISNHIMSQRKNVPALRRTGTMGILNRTIDFNSGCSWGHAAHKMRRLAASGDRPIDRSPFDSRTSHGQADTRQEHNRLCPCAVNGRYRTLIHGGRDNHRPVRHKATSRSIWRISNKNILLPYTCYLELWMLTQITENRTCFFVTSSYHKKCNSLISQTVAIP